MAQIDVKSGLVADSARVLNDPRDQLQPADSGDKPQDELSELTAWVLSRVRLWRDHRRANYELLWDLYERLWRGIWSSEDKNRKSEKSELITPALAEAVENIVAEVEEALWGRGDSFDMKAAFGASEDAKKITDDNKAKLKEDLGRADFNPNIGEALINAAVYGSGIGEVIVETFTLREITASVQAAYPNAPQDPTALGAPPVPTTPPAFPGTPDATQAAPVAPQMPQLPPEPGMMPPAAPAAPMPGGMTLPTPPVAKVIEREVTYACLQSVNPRNFLIDPTARTIDKALGVAIEEYVGAHIINAGIRDGKYRDVDVGTSAGDTIISPSWQTENEYVHDKVHIIRYYGLVPKHLLFPPDRTADLTSDVPGEQLGLAVRAAEDAAEQQEVVVDLNVGSENAVSGQDSVEPIDGEMVEALIFIANEQIAIKALENPYLMKDRPVVAFPWDVVPGRFWGRGVCEKGMVPQRVLDAEMRARIDALAFISAPMMGMDASRLPRGFQLTVKPGKSILTNGDPNTVLRPLHFGQLDQSTFTHSQQLDQMIQRATGSLDVIALAQKGGGDTRPGAMSMMLSGIVKRHKRTLMGFIDRFYVPALRKILWRNMQYWPERYTPRNWDFVASSTMGILQREYESANLAQLMNTMEPGSPEYKMLLMGVVSNTGLTHRQDIINMLKQSIATAQQMAQAQAAQAQQATSPDSQNMQGQIAAAGAQLQLAELQAKITELQSRANLQNVKARNAALEPQFKKVEIATKGIYQVAADQQHREFDHRMQMTDRILKARDIASNERIATTQSQASLASEAIKARAQVAAAGANASGKTHGEIIKAAGHVAKAMVPPQPPVPVTAPQSNPNGWNIRPVIRRTAQPLVARSAYPIE